LRLNFHMIFRASRAGSSYTMSTTNSSLLVAGESM
jgi:hypothetical protein